MSLTERIYKTDTNADDGHLVVISSEDAALSDGKQFHGTFTFTGGISTAVSVLISTPTVGSGIYSATAECNANKEGSFTWSEAPNATSTGATVITLLNMNRNSTASTTIQAWGQPTYTSSGTILENEILSGAAVTGNSSQPDVKTDKWILSPSQSYLIRFTPSFASTSVSINFELGRED